MDTTLNEYMERAASLETLISDYMNTHDYVYVNSNQEILDYINTNCQINDKIKSIEMEGNAVNVVFYNDLLYTFLISDLSDMETMLRGSGILSDVATEIPVVK